MSKSAGLTNEIHRLGVAQSARHILPTLAMKLATAAQQKRLKPDDALEVYIDYYKAASRLKTIDPYDNGVKANVSKLRQIIKAADPELLGRVTAAHSKMALTQNVRPLYHAMVAACRWKNVKGSRPDKAQLARLIRR